MGDRANIRFYDGESSFYFYTHWEGSRLPKTLQDALKRSVDRWDDPPYLARIIFSEMIKGNVEYTTGYGISTYIVDGGSRVLIVDAEKKMVSLCGRHASSRSWTFQEYLEIDPLTVW
jgi:hypothetical protein